MCVVLRRRFRERLDSCSLAVFVENTKRSLERGPGAAFSHIALSFCVYASASLPSLKTSHRIAAIATAAIAVLVISPMNSIPSIGCVMSLHFKRATKLAMIKEVVDHSSS